ncbi:MAG: hypothetical protein NWF04_04835 [Candidatus Bathyarchaeota archaeon]|nr:hypothetical protein [Candidatus Bathyarchaeota archaeon]
MNKPSDYTPSIKTPSFLVLIGVCAFFVWTQYEIYQSTLFSIDLIANFGIYSEMLGAPWWAATFYGSELGGTVGGILRWLASFLALYAAFAYWRGGNAVFSKIKGKIGWALLLEAGYFLLLIPTVWLGLIFPSTNGEVWYFEVTPVPEVFFVAGIACLAMVLVLPPVLLKLRGVVLHDSFGQMLKWGCVVAVAYLFVVFWFNSAMQWTGMLATWGTDLLLDSMNTAGFVSSSIFLLVVAFYALKTTYPTIQNPATKLNPKHVAATSTAFGAYFIFAILVYFNAGGFATHRSAWFELIVPHNPYLWCLIFFFIGLPLMLTKTPKPK